MGNKSDPKKKFSAHVLLYDRNSNAVLLHQRDENTVFDPNRWAFFGGKCEENEAPEECAVRELAEETGIRVNTKDITPLADYFNDTRETHRYVFFAKKWVSKSDINLTEGKDCEWVLLDKVFDYDLSETAERDLKIFLRTQK